jgi:hypothetical protein
LPGRPAQARAFDDLALHALTFVMLAQYLKLADESDGQRMTSPSKKPSASEAW